MLAETQSVCAPYPKVFVMNPYYSGIGIGRALHGKKVAVYALTSERDAPGARSRYFTGVYDVPNGRDAPQQLCERLIELQEGCVQRPVLFPTRDLDVLFLHDYRDVLSRHYILPQPDET